jgi:hypothetical protein
VIVYKSACLDVGSWVTVTQAIAVGWGVGHLSTLTFHDLLPLALTLTAVQYAVTSELEL